MTIQFPKHSYSLQLTHNDHRDYYVTLAHWVADDEQSECPTQWSSEADKREAIETDEMWELIWYPLTPIGSHHIAAPTLEKLLAFAATFDEDDEESEA